MNKTLLFAKIFAPCGIKSAASLSFLRSLCYNGEKPIAPTFPGAKEETVCLFK